MATPRRPRVAGSGHPMPWPEAVNRFMTWLENRERSRYTLRNYRDDLQDFALWWENEGNPSVALLPTNITEEDLRAWKRYLRTEPLDDTGRVRKPASVNVKLAAIKSFLGWCHDKAVIAIKPELPTQVVAEARAVKALDEGEQRELLRAARNQRSKRTWPIVFIMIETGLRLAELVALRRRDLDISERKGELRVREGKGGKPRTLPIDPEVRRAFKTLLGPGTGPDDPVFASQRRDADGNPKPLTGRGIQEILDRLREDLGWDELHPHMLRHTYGMNLRRAGTDWPVIARLMGHGSIITTMTHYGTPSEKDLIKAMNRRGPADDD